MRRLYVLLAKVMRRFWSTAVKHLQETLAKRLAIPPGNVVRMACMESDPLNRNPEIIDRNVRVLRKDLRPHGAGLLRLDDYPEGL